MAYEGKDLPVRIISLRKEKYEEAAKHISAICNFTDVKWWKAVRGSDLFEESLRLLPNYRAILAETNSNATFPQRTNLLSTQTEISLGTGTRTNIYDLHNVGAIGCSLSHISLWQHMVDHQIPAMIVFEDDVQFLGEFSNGTRNCIEELNTFLATFGLNFDVLNLNIFPIPKSLVHGAVLTPSSLMSNVYRLHGVAFRTQGYIITLAGAKKLLKNAFPLIHTVDTYMTMSTMLPSMQENFIYLAMHPVWLNHPSLDLGGSTIGYDLLQSLTDSILFLPRIVVFAIIGICILSLVATVVLIAVLIRASRNQKNQGRRQKSLAKKRTVKSTK